MLNIRFSLTNQLAFAIRGGVRASRDVQNLFGGFGVNIGGLQIDYAIQDGMAGEINGVGSTHFASLSLIVTKGEN